MVGRFAAFIISIFLVACSPPQRTLRDAPSNDAVADAAPAEDAGERDARLGDGGRSDAGPDGGAPDSGVTVVLAPGRLLAKASFTEGGGEVRVEEVEGAIAVRIAASEKAALSVEPAASLTGPASAGVVFGVGCREVSKGAVVELGRWTGELCNSIIATQPLAVIERRSPLVGCPIERAPAGAYELSLFACGRYAEEVVKVRFELPAEQASPPAPDAGGPDAALPMPDAHPTKTAVPDAGS